MPAEKGIFLDILPRFDMVALGVILDKIGKMFSKTGAAWGASLGAEAETKIRRLAVEVTKANNAVTDSDIRAERAAHAHEVARLRLHEIQGRQSVAASTLARATYAVADADALATARARDAAAARTVQAAAEEKHATALAASAVAAGNLGKVLNVGGMAATGGFVYGMLESGKAAGNFQERLLRLVASAGESMSNLDVVAKGLQDVAVQTGYSANELADGMYLIEKSGHRGADGITVMRAAAQLARAENASLDEVIQGLTTTMHDFHVPVSGAATVASKMNIAVGDSRTTLQLFSNALHNIEPIAMVAKMRFEEVYAAMALITQSGTTPMQGSQQLSNMVQHFINIQQPQREAMNKMGLDADILKQKLGDPKVGLAGVLNVISTQISKHLTPDQLVYVDTMYKSVGAANSMRTMYENMSAGARGLVDSVKSGTMSWNDFRKAAKESNIEDKAQLMQWDNLAQKAAGFSTNLKKMQSQEETVAQIWKEITGTDAGFKVAAQLAGTPEALAAFYAQIKRVDEAHTEADGTVHGFNITLEGLNAQLRVTKAAFGNAAIDLGNVFLPVLTRVAEGLGWVGKKLDEHPGILQTITAAIGAMSTAWLLWKTYVVGAWIWGKIALGVETVTVAVRLMVASILGTGPAAATAAAQTAVATTAQAASIGNAGRAAVVSSGQIVGMGAAATAATPAVVGAAAAQSTAITGVGLAASRASILVAGIGVAAFAAIPAVLALVAAIDMTTAAKRAPAWGGDQAMTDATADDSITEEDTKNLKVPAGVPLPGSADAEGGMSSLAIQGDPGAIWVTSTRSKWDQAARYAWYVNNYKEGEPFRAPDTYITKADGSVGGKGAEPKPKMDTEALTEGLHGDQKKAVEESILRQALGLPPADTEAMIPDSLSQMPSPTEELIPKPGSGGDAPEGSKDDPLYTLPVPGSLSVNGGGSQGDGTTDNIGYNYDPFSKAGSGGFTLPNLAKLMATFFANAALGNPYGKLEAMKGKAGESPNNPLYTQQVNMPGADGGYITVTKDQLKMINATVREEEAQARYGAAVSKYGEDSPEARRAALQVLNAQQAKQRLEIAGSIPKNSSGTLQSRGLANQDVNPDGLDSLDYLGEAADAEVLPGLPAGGGGRGFMNFAQASRYLDARAANPMSDSALLSNVPAGRYSQISTDLTKGLGDCSSAVEDLVNLMDGRSTAGRSMSTGNAAEWLTSRGFMPGTKPGAFNVGFNSRHMQATMMDGTPFNWGSDAAAARGGVGGSGAYDPSLTSRYYRYKSGGSILGAGSSTSDDIPAWLSNGEHVLTANDVQAMGGQSGVYGFRKLLHSGLGFDVGGAVGAVDPEVPPVPAVSGVDPLSVAHGTGLGAAPGQPNPPSGSPDGAVATDGTKQMSSSSGSKGFGIGGGLIGAATSAGAGALNMVAPGAGTAAQIGLQEANRAVGYIGQLAGIGVAGLLETFGLSGSSIADPSKSKIGKLAMGIAGARPSTPNTAGQTVAPLKPQVAAPAPGPAPGSAPMVVIENMNNHGADGQQVGRDIGRELMSVSPNGN